MPSEFVSLWKSIFFRDFFPKLSPNCCLLCNSLVLMSFYQVHYASSSSQNARTGQICCFFSTSKVWKAFSFRGGGFAPWFLTPQQGLCPGPRWGLCPQIPVIGSCSALAMAWPPPMKISAYASGTQWINTVLKLHEGGISYRLSEPQSSCSLHSQSDGSIAAKKCYETFSMLL